MRIVSLALLLASAAAIPAVAADLVLQPGMQYVPINGCAVAIKPVIGFIFDGVGDDAGRVFFPLAACESPNGRMATPEGIEFAAVVFRESGSRGLAEVYPQYRDSVRGEVLGEPGTPTGAAEWGSVPLGTPVTIAGEHAPGVILPRALRTGVLYEHSARGLYVMTAPQSTGVIDAGNRPVLDPSGLALGTLGPNLSLGVPTATFGPTVSRTIALAAEHGLEIELRTAS